MKPKSFEEVLEEVKGSGFSLQTGVSRLGESADPLPKCSMPSQ